MKKFFGRKDLNTFLKNLNKKKQEISLAQFDEYNENTISNIFTDSSSSPFRTQSSRFNLSQIKTILNVEDVLENVYSLRFFSNKIGKSFNSISSTSSSIRNFSQLINMFRSDFDEIDLNYDIAKKPYNTNFKLKFLNSQNLNFNLHNFTETSFNISEIPNLRSTAKNAIISANAIGKVFRNRYEDKRSHAKIDDFSNIDSLQPFISGTRPQYEKFLQKNNNHYFNHALFKPILNLSQSQLVSSNLPSFVNPFDIPFMIAMKSEASRYL